MRTRIVILGAWMLGTAVTSGLAWATVGSVETRITTQNATVVSPRDVDLAAAPLSISSTTEVAPNSGATANATLGAAVTVSTSVPLPPETTVEVAAPPSVPTTSRPPTQQTTPTTSAGTPPPPTTPTTTAGAPTQVIATVGGNIAASCPTPSTIRLVYASPNPGYSYVPEEITAAHIHVKFTKTGRSIEVEAECSGGKVESSVGNDG